MIRLSISLLVVFFYSCHESKTIQSSDLNIVIQEYKHQLRVIKDKAAHESNIETHRLTKLISAIDLVLDDLEENDTLEASMDSIILLLNDDPNFKRKDRYCSDELWLNKNKFANKNLSLIASLDYIKKVIHCILLNPLFCGFRFDDLHAYYAADTLYLPEHRTFDLPIRNSRDRASNTWNQIK